jgi:hypothetical protein
MFLIMRLDVYLHLMLYDSSYMLYASVIIIYSVDSFLYRVDGMSVLISSVQFM